MSENWEPLVCPVCRRPLGREGNTLKCDAGHSFDMASGGYVNLLRSGKAGAGDSRKMVEARHAFLEKGYYAFFRDALARTAAARAAGPVVTLVDAGCGEGYYTAEIAGALRAGGRTVRAAGIDLSKTAVKRAARRDRKIRFAVAGIFDMPVADAGADMVLSIFAPVAAAEIRRVLRPGGLLIMAAPGPRHLYGLKEVLYDRPYENEKSRTDFPGFELAEEFEVNDTVRVTGREDIARLFAMTPYYWRTPARSAGRLNNLTSLTTPLEFTIHILRKTDV